MGKSAKISVIMPACNSEKYVSEAMDSVIGQTCKSWELIAVDDGSTDHTGKTIDEYAARDCRIRAVHTVNKGVSHARNTGLDLARGEWVAFLDSDDKYEVDAFEAMLEESSDADLVIGNYKLNRETGERSIIQKTKGYKSFADTKPDFGEYVKTGVLNVIWGKLIRRDQILTRFCEECSHGEDMMFLISLLKSVGPIKFITPCVYIYRRDNETSLSHQFDYDYVKTVESIAKNYINFFDDARVTKMIYANYLRGIIGDIKMLFHTPGYGDDFIRRYISALIESDFLRQIPPAQYPFTPFGQRMAALLLIGDLDMIMDEFRKKQK